MSNGTIRSRSFLEVRNLSKTFDGLTVLTNVSFPPLRGGSIMGMIGPNGAGKTTLINVILGLLNQDVGTVMLNGTSIDKLRPWQRARMGIGCLWQKNRLFWNLPALENLLVAAPDVSYWDAIDFLIRRKRQQLCEVAKLESAEQILQRIGLAGMEQTLARNLSYGQQRLLAIGRLLISDPDILLLDEPLEGLDPHLTSRILGIIHELRDAGKATILIEHDPFVVNALADVVYVMREGSLALHVSNKAAQAV